MRGIMVSENINIVTAIKIILIKPKKGIGDWEK